MKNKIKSILLVILCFFMTTLANAQDKTEEMRGSFSVETDPSTFAFNGYAFHFRYKPKKSQHFVLGAGTYALNLPDVMVNMNPENKNEGWNVRINSAYSLFGEYYLKKATSKWFVGLQVGVQNYKNSNEQIDNKTCQYSNLLVMPSLGYNWYPFKFPLYVKPWLGLGYTSQISGDNFINEKVYNISPLVPFLTLHVGYTLGK